MSKLLCLFSKNLVVHLILIFLVGLVVFWPSFMTGLYGDEWQMLWYAKAARLNPELVGPGTIWNAYGFEMTVFNIIAELFGYDGRFFYAFSFICRFFAVLTFYFFIKRRNVNPIAALMGGLLLMVSPIGLEATDWARNFDSYLGLGILLIVIDRILCLKSWRDFLLSVLLTMVLFLINPLRSHGSILLILGLISVKLSIEPQKIKLAWLFIATLAVYFLFIKLNIFGSLTDFNPILELKSGMFLKTYLGNIGRILVSSYSSQWMGFIIVAILILYWKSELFFKNQKIFHISLIFFLLITISLAYKLYLNGSIYQSSILIGIFFLVWLVFFGLVEFFSYKKSELYETIIIGLFLMSFLLFPAIRQVDFQAGSEHRYLIYSAVVIPLIVVFAFSKLVIYRKKVLSILGFGLIIIVLAGFSLSSWKYLNEQKQSHELYFTSTLWQNLYIQLLSYDFQKNRAGVIIVAPPETKAKIGNSVQFGFGFHMGLLFEIWKEDQLPYLIIEDKLALLSLIETGEGSKKYLGSERMIPKENIIVLKIDGANVQKVNLDEYLNNKEMQNANY